MSLHHSSIPKGIHELDVILNQLNYHDRIQYAYNLGKKYSQSSELSNLLSDIFKVILILLTFLFIYLTFY